MRLESYDLFDTLITRITRKPVDVFRLLGCSEAIHFRWKVAGIVPFHVWRRRAERIARWRSHREDIQLVDVYRLLGLIIRQPARIMRLEISLEEAVIRPMPEAIAQVHEQHASGAPCCIVSDMYLPRHVIHKLVRSHLPLVPVHVSSDIGLTKASGRLFQHVAESHRVPLEEIHHRGDNAVSDHAVPLRLGMQATHLPIPEESDSAASALDVLKCPHKGDPLYEMGFRVAGPTAFAMAVYLADRVARARPRNIIFAARDMHLMQMAFRHLCPEVDTHYCRISRSAVYRAQLYANRDVQRLFEGVTSGEEFFTRLGLSCPPALSDIIPFQHPQRFLSALNAMGLGDESEIEYATVKSYLEQEGFGDNTLFVDLGWRGSIQDAVRQIVTPSAPIEGCYFGTLQKQQDKHGIYFDGSRPTRRFHRVIQAISFFEFLFTEAVPSLQRIVKSGATFDLVPTSDETPEQMASRLRITEGARDFIELMIPLHNAVGFHKDQLLRSLDKLYDRYLLNPPQEWVEALDAMTHSGGFGGSGKSPLIGSDAATPLEFLKAPWKGGYVVKHRNSAWLPLFKAMHSQPFFVAYDALKMAVRQRRASRLRKRGAASES